MRKGLLCMVCSSMLFSGLAVAAQADFNFDKHWAKVESYTNKQLPKSALRETELIFDEAQRQGNFAQSVKAFVHRMHFTRTKDRHATDRLIRDFEAFTSQGDFSVPERALLHSMTAELYAMRYADERYTIDRRTATPGYVPDSIAHWSRNNFLDKINAELDLSLAEVDLLKQTSLSPYEPLLKHPDKPFLTPCRPDELYSFLTRRAIDILTGMAQGYEINDRVFSWYQQLEATAEAQGDTTTLVLNALKRLEHERNHSDRPDRDERYGKALQELRTRYADHESVVEVLYQLARHINNDYDYTRNHPDHKRQAYDLCTEGMTRFPRYARINLLKNMQEAIQGKSIHVQTSSVVKPHSPLTFTIHSENIETLQVKIYRVQATAEEYYQYEHKQDSWGYPRRRLHTHTSLTTKNDSLFRTVIDTLTVTTGDYGIYEYEIYEKGYTQDASVAQGAFIVSNLTALYRQIDEQQNQLYVLDRVSGERIPQVEVHTYQRTWDRSTSKYLLIPTDTLITDAEGSCHFKQPDDYRAGVPIFFLRQGEDRYLFSDIFHTYYNRPTEQQDHIELSLFTDRSLYRPGQAVQFKGIAYRPGSQEVVADTDFEVKLLDANRKEVSRQTFRTNEFGSFSGTFLLPEGALGGAYRLQSEHGSLTFRVEEYKRPTFEVAIDPMTDEVSFGEAVNCNGKVQSYAGYAVANASVRYTVTRRTHRWWGRWNEPDKVVADGTLTTGADGQFSIRFTPERTAGSNPFLREQYYIYVVEAVATDSRGETQRAEQSFSVGDKSLNLSLSIPATVEKSSPARVGILAETLNGSLVATDVRYTLQRLNNPDEYLQLLPEFYEWTVAEDITSGTFHTAERHLSLDLTACTPGQYRLTTTTTDNRGREVKSDTRFTVYDRTAERAPFKTYLWITEEKTECAPGEQAEIRFGTSADSVHVLYEIMRGSTLLESRWLTLNNEVQAFYIPFLASYGDGVNVQFTFIKDEQQFSRTVTLKRKVEEKRLTPTWSTFRDKVRPGETAEWTLTLPDTTHGKRTAEVMAAMYDASLDAIYPHQWLFSPQPALHIPYSPSWNGSGLSSGYAYGSYYAIAKEVPNYCYRALNWFGYGREDMVVTGYSRPNILKKMFGSSQRSMKAPAPMDNIVASDTDFVFEGVLEENAVTAAGASDNTATPRLRQNFNETAFFYPHLRTDEKGQVRIAFTVPESLTRWQVNVLAHTPDLYSGQLSATAVTQQELMVRPNLPRFVRRSDKWVLTADVVNLTDSTLHATTTLQLIDPATDKPIRLADGTARTLTLAGGETRTVSWHISEQTAHDLLVVRLEATAGTFSDGEQHYLPVLPDQILVTETQPITVHGGEKRTFTFERLLENATSVRSQSLTVEMASNPAWYAVLALPGLTEPTGKSAIDYYTAFYSASLATHIVRTYPKIAEVFDRWKLAEGSKEALLSNLEKNSELKNVLLEETPWVLEASDETEQRRRIALLFDLNLQKNRTSEYLAQLTALQRPDGGFEWYKGMGSNRHVTQTILLGIGRLVRMTGQDISNEEWVRKALTYIDTELARDYQNLKMTTRDFKNRMCIGNTQWHYLHVRSEFADVPVDKSAVYAIKFYTEQAYRYWAEATLYGKAATAVIAHRNKQTDTSHAVMASLRELALHSDDMGMYWNNLQDARYWDARPEFVQTALIEAFAETGSTREELDAMALWLLRQKQTQRWDSPTATADAVYALLTYGNDRLEGDGKVDVKVGNRTLRPARQEAGTGYFKTTIASTDITARMGNITVKKSDDGVAWGAAYWQYWQDIDQVAQSGNGLTIRKQLFVERMENGTRIMLPAETAGVRRGDRVITRLEITTDRHLEYVALKDLRAAGLEPVEQLSGYERNGNAGCYRTSKDNATHFFFDRLPQGTYVLEYDSWANNAGDFANGTASIQCLYAPEFTAHSAGERVTISE